MAFIVLFFTAPILPFNLNFIPSMPRGLYYTYDCSPTKGDIIEFRPLDKAWQFAVDREYVSGRMEDLLKIVVAISRDRVCWKEDKMPINGQDVGDMAAEDSLGRPLGHVLECITVLEGQSLAMAPGYHKSYDGRYLGLINP